MDVNRWSRHDVNDEWRSTIGRTSPTSVCRHHAGLERVRASWQAYGAHSGPHRGLETPDQPHRSQRGLADTPRLTLA